MYLQINTETKCVRIQFFNEVRFEVFTAVSMKNGVFWNVTPCALVRTDVSEELSASFIKVKRIGELGTTLAVTSNRRKLRRNFRSLRRFLQEQRGVTSQKTPFFSSLTNSKEGHPFNDVLRYVGQTL
jgi:hypothetical protein